MKPCPKCNKEVQEESADCPYCGIIFAKWEKLRQNAAEAPASSLTDSPAEPEPAARSGAGIKVAVAVAAVALAAGYFLLKGDPTPPDAVYTNYLSAMQANDTKAVESFLSKEMLAELKGSDTPFETVIQAIAAQQPKNPVIKTRTIEGKTALFALEGQGPLGGNSAGAVRMTRESGKWKLADETWLEDMAGVNKAAGYVADDPQFGFLVGHWQESPDSPELLSFTSDGKVQNIMIARDAEDPAKRFTNVATVGNFKLTDPDHLELSVGPAKQVIEIKVTNETLIMVSEGTETVLQRYAP
ncbi:MAG: hypothetical protein A3J79_07415 [Elusimicrobia bacterium RIFOXYB2_FULL_62_6]|nr:MAG: hypothetical protein A3J79_07415 [Elusimicrobia bacterium RIFOXYB2_FULL_62_6]